MRLHRFKVSQPLGEEVVIDAVSLIDQWRKVFRYDEGQEVILFNGDGFEVVYSISLISKSSCTLRLISKSIGNVPHKETHLFLCLIKKDNVELVIQKAVELGVTHIHLITSERVEKKHVSYERLAVIANEALEQCGRADSVAIFEAVSLIEALAHSHDTLKCFILHMDGQPLLDTVSRVDSDARPCAYFIGPEGGWSPSELSLFEVQNVLRVSLSKQVLRAETAAIACATLACYQ
jgi:16S rRNA (uracil1498-N3)-methyltransferase